MAFFLFPASQTPQLSMNEISVQEVRGVRVVEVKATPAGLAFLLVSAE
jgi:hypothetical protein